MLGRGNITFVEYQMCKTVKCFRGCAGVNHHSFESEFCSVHTQNHHLGDSLPDWNAVVSPENFTVCMWPNNQLKVSIMHASWTYMTLILKNM